MTAPSLPRIYGALVRGELIATSGYRANLIVSIVGWVIPFVMLALWRGAAEDGAIEGVTAGQFTSYFALILLTTTLSFSAHLIYGFTPLVHEGRLADYLVRPYHPFHNLIAGGAARVAFRAPVAAVFCIGVITILGGALGGWRNAVIAIPVWIIGALTSGYLGALAGSLALWVTKAYAVQSLVIGTEGLLGGLYAPIALLPGWLEVVARHTPFWFQIGAPAELMAGMIGPGDGLQVIAEGVVWLVVLHVVFRTVWRRGVTQYELVGG